MVFRRSLVAVASSALTLAIPALASAQDPNRGALVISVPQPASPELEVLVEVDGRRWPIEHYDTPMPIPAGRHLVHAYAKRSSDGAALAPGHNLAITVLPGVVFSVPVPVAKYGSRSGLMGGGIAVTTIGVLATIGSILTFYVADAAGTECHEEGFATGACGAEPGPIVGGATTLLLFGVSGLIGGPVMIAEGVKPQVTWQVPEINFGPSGGRLTWRF